LSVLRIAVVGAGAMGRLHARAVTRRAESVGDCTLEVVVDRYRNRAEKVAAEFGGRAEVSGYSDWSAVDAAIVAIPTVGHASAATALLEAGLDVLLEKPMALSVSEARRIASIAEESERILQVGHTEWYNPGWRSAVDRVGKLQSIEVERLNPRTERGLDIDVVQDLALHDLDWITRIVGEEILSIDARGRAVHNTTLDEARVEIRFASGLIARLDVSRVHETRRRIVRVKGSDGVAEADLITGRLTSASPENVEIPSAELSGPASTRESLDAQWADFVRACRERKAPANDARVGVASIVLVERVRNAIGSGTEGTGDANDSAVRR
jgi:predicted dehydrogenase